MVIDLEDGSSNDQEESLLHHLKPSVAKRMKTRNGRFVAKLMSARKAKKTAEDVEEDVPDISLLKKTTDRKSPVKVPAVHLDNISFHLEDGAAKWKFMIQRRAAVERELGKDAIDVKEVMDMIKVAGLLKTVSWFSQFYEGRKIEGVGELEVTDNEVCREITARKVKSWPVKKHLPTGKLTVKYAILHKMGAANWVPTNHISTIANSIGSNEEEVEAHTSSERFANHDDTSGNSDSSADEAASSSSTDLLTTGYVLGFATL
ncbi:uncharacterized protein LOC127130915 [Lathyrus oleraceus]|uniref:uncharacterized protein LOC127130915 n=1 Tax=Pisum sativum TaxID=3888 RepID=UPI0021D3E3C2|nr:uncharacterized protein LOC127130915 [Pisum sativum]